MTQMEDIWVRELAAVSPSKRWRVEWMDEGTKGRARTLLDEHVVRELAGLERPQDAAISDDGSTVVLDWTADRAGRPRFRSALLFFTPAGDCAAFHQFRANADRMYASYENDLVVLELLDTAEEDEVKKARFRLSTGERLFANAWPI